MICPICNTENRAGAKFCDECGHRFIGESDIPPLFPADFDSKRTEDSAAVEEQSSDALRLEDMVPEIETATQERVPEEMPQDFEDAIPDDDKPVNVMEQVEPHELDDFPDDVLIGESSSSVADDEPISEPEPDVDVASEPESAVSDSEADDRPVIKDYVERDFSGFVFADPEQNVGPDKSNIQAFETAAIPLASIWGSGNTQAMPRITDEAVAAGMNVSAPANKKEERQRNRELKKREREARAALKRNERSAKGRNFVLIVLLVIAAVAVLAVGVGYYLELWGGKTIPATQGMTQADAVYTLQNEGFTVRVDSVKSDDTEGLVLLSDPAAGSRVAEGSEIVIHVSESRTIPLVVGTSSDLALAALAEAGYSNIAELQYEKTNTEAEGTVLEVSPAEGTKSKSSTKVTLKVATPYRVPDVTGMSQNDAIYTLREAGYYVYTSEVETTALPEGTVYTTQPAADTILDQNEFVTIYTAVQRSSKLVSAATSYLQSAGSVTLAGTTYTIVSVDSVTYSSNGIVKFTITGQPTMTFLGETVTLSARSVSGSMTYDDNNQLVSIS